VHEQAKITSKGQVTIPQRIRRLLGVAAGDRLVFESDGDDVRVRPARKKSAFLTYRGIGNPHIGSGKKNIQLWLRQLRGHDDRD
jgi:AbrB family looped-hinge helix DNA binding protein